MEGDRGAADAPTTAESIAERAAELFAKNGFAGTSIREIAEAAGVTKPTLYYYFGSKEGLVQHIVRGATRGFGEAIARSIARGVPLADTLSAIALGQLAFADSRPATVTLICRLQHQPPGETSVEPLRADQEEGLRQLSHRFDEAMARGEIARRDSTLLALSFLGALITHIVARQRMAPAARPPADVVSRHVVDLFLRGAEHAPEVSP